MQISRCSFPCKLITIEIFLLVVVASQQNYIDKYSTISLIEDNLKRIAFDLSLSLDKDLLTKSAGDTDSLEKTLNCSFIDSYDLGSSISLWEFLNSKEKELYLRRHSSVVYPLHLSSILLASNYGKDLLNYYEVYPVS